MIVDPRGIGAVRAHAAGGEGIGIRIRSKDFRLANYHFLLGTSLAARRAFDVLQALAVLRACPALPADVGVHLVAYGWTSLYGLLATVVDGQLAGCHFHGLPASWAAAFADQPVADDAMCEPLLLPELAGCADIADLLGLCSPITG